MWIKNRQVAVAQFSLLPGLERAGYDFNIRPGTLTRLRNLHPQLNRPDGTMRIAILKFWLRDVPFDYNHKASTLQGWRDQIVQGRRFYRTDSTKGCSVAGLRKESLDRNVAPQILASRIIQVHTKMSWRIGCGKYCLNWIDKPKRMRLNQSPAVVNLDAEAMESALCGVGRGKWISMLHRNRGI